MRLKQFLLKKSTKKLLFIGVIISTLIMHIILRLSFVLYGYIATEEGSMIHQQSLAHQGLLPFIHYDAWNSLANDYLIGWFQVFVEPSILNERLFGFLIALLVVYLTLQVANYFKNSSIVILTLIFLTFGSYSYIYISNIPYSEQTMTFFLMISLFSLTKSLSVTRYQNLLIFLTLLVSLFSSVVRIQAIPATVLIWISTLYLFRNKVSITKWLALISITANLFVLLPYLRDLNALKHAVFWPFLADKIIVYQRGEGLTFTSFIVFIQEVIRDYIIFIALILSGITAGFSPRFIKKIKLSTEYIILLLLFLISSGFLLSGLLHKPPYASYTVPGVPLLAILAAYVLHITLIKVTPLFQRFIITFLAIILISNTLVFPHYKFIKTSIASISKTPHSYLEDLAQYVQKYSEPQDEILSFYTPITVMAKRQVPHNFNRDRFSITLLENQEAIDRHMTNSDLLEKYISKKTPKLIIFSDKNILQFAATQNERDIMLNAIKQNFDLILETDTIQFIETPKYTKLFIYKVKKS